MYLTRLQVEGFRGADPDAIEHPGRCASIGALPGGCAIADALDLLAAGLDQAQMAPVAARIGWATEATAVEGDPGEAQLQGLHPPAVDATLEPKAQPGGPTVRSGAVDATFALDPPLFGRMRAHAVRDPRMVTALGHEPSVRIKVGWLSNRDRTAAHPTVLAVGVGEMRFDVAGKDRPHWLPELLPELGGRFHRLEGTATAETIAGWILEASLSPDPARRAGLEAALDALTGPPFALPRPAVVRSGGRIGLAFGPDLVDARRLGRAATDAVRLAVAAFVRRPDVLVVDDALPAHPDVWPWLRALPEREDAPIEQIWTLPPPDPASRSASPSSDPPQADPPQADPPKADAPPLAFPPPKPAPQEPS